MPAPKEAPKSEPAEEKDVPAAPEQPKAAGKSRSAPKEHTPPAPPALPKLRKPEWFDHVFPGLFSRAPKVDPTPEE